MNICVTFVFILLLVEILTYDLSQIKFIIMSQTHTRHATLGLETEEKLKMKLTVIVVTNFYYLFYEKHFQSNLAYVNPVTRL